MRPFSLVLFLLLTGCVASGPRGRCDATTCMGCCDSRGTCQLGSTASFCGQRGATCGVCGLGLICSQGLCGPPSLSVNPGAGGGSTTSGGGPGAGGGTPGRAWQELASGTRLKAIHLTGDDGSKAPLSWGLNVSAIFWDSQLSLYCTPRAQGVPTPLCEPLGLAWESSEGGDFADSGCTMPAGTANDPADLNRALTAGGLPTSTVTHLRVTDAQGQHTYFAAMRVPSGAPRHYRSSESSACVASGTFREAAWAAAAPVPVGTFASMSVTRD
ncbi:MAG: hypothetical protein JNJ54_29760 [Myxococcaceae bacterium]|nr:hypothetical protein [Myxococcaceae bacterium]